MKSRWVIGVHACKEVFKVRPQAIEEVLFKKNFKSNLIDDMETICKKHHINYKKNTPLSHLDSIHPLHQGVALRVNESPQWRESFLDHKKSTLLFLDGIEDAQNLGAIFRTAWLTGHVHGIFIRQNQRLKYTPFVAKAACGGFEHVPLEVCEFKNTIARFQKKGYWSYGFSAEAKKSLFNTQFSEKSIIVLGSENKGIRKPVEALCDELIHIPQHDKESSYNVSVATAFVLCETLRQNL